MHCTLKAVAWRAYAGQCSLSGVHLKADWVSIDRVDWIWEFAVVQLRCV
jgi:hypothetical protein